MGEMVRQPGGGLFHVEHTYVGLGQGVAAPRWGLPGERSWRAAGGPGTGGMRSRRGDGLDVSRETLGQVSAPNRRGGARSPRAVFAGAGRVGRLFHVKHRMRVLGLLAATGGRAPGSATVSRETVMWVQTGLARCRRRPSAAPVRAGGPRWPRAPIGTDAVRHSATTIARPKREAARREGRMA